VAGALQDHDRAWIFGENTFGKGLVQTVFPMAENTGLALTTARYYTPSNRLIQRDYTNTSFFDYYYRKNLESKNMNDVGMTDTGRKVYGGGGNSGATLKNDFIEIINRTGSPVDLNGWSVQYASSALANWTVTPLATTSVVLQPGQYFLIQEAAGTGGTVDLPTPDATGTIAMGGTAGKIALVSNATALTGTCPSDPVILDFVGYGGASCFEGSGTASTLPSGAGMTSRASTSRARRSSCS
jgi:hypothetical protein